MTPPRGWELIIILVIILLLFGPGRLSKIAGEIGRGISEFRQGLRADEEETADQEHAQEPEEPKSEA
jgi:sec-independent protein translocase protein TatA